MNAIIKIVGTQTVDDQQDTVEMTTGGTLERLEHGWKLCYHETEATGMEGTITTLDIGEDKLHLTRSGTHPSMLILEKHQRHHCNYYTPYGTIDLGTYTSELDCQLGDHGGEVKFSYTLGFNGGVSSAHTIHITVQEES
ncbi:MAG: DUF1934 domain-containing protein [Ruminococcaceae bacterium]|nr:DUF1934 domain-containing protein [Oscillospiraceae bacterium]